MAFVHRLDNVGWSRLIGITYAKIDSHLRPEPLRLALFIDFSEHIAAGLIFNLRETSISTELQIRKDKK